MLHVFLAYRNLPSEETGACFSSSNLSFGFGTFLKNHQ